MDTSPSPHYRRAAAIAAGGAALLIAFLAFRRGDSQHEPVPAWVEAPSPPAPASARPSQYTECRELEAIRTRMRKKLGCTPEDAGNLWEQERTFCEAIFTEKSRCVNDLKAAYACAKREPESSWKCEAQSTVAMIDAACESEVGALRACLLRDQ